MIMIIIMMMTMMMKMNDDYNDDDGSHDDDDDDSDNGDRNYYQVLLFILWLQSPLFFNVSLSPWLYVTMMYIHYMALWWVIIIINIDIITLVVVWHYYG